MTEVCIQFPNLWPVVLYSTMPATAWHEAAADRILAKPKSEVRADSRNGAKKRPEVVQVDKRDIEGRRGVVIACEV